MTLKEFAKRAECSPQLIYDLCKSQQLTHRRLGRTPGKGKITLTEETLAEFLKSREIPRRAS